MAEVTQGQQLRIYNPSTGGYYQTGIEKTGISRNNVDETVGGIKTFTADNLFNGNNTFQAGKTQTFNGPVSFAAGSGQELVANITFTKTQIVGNAAGDIGHASGAEIVAAPGAGFILIPTRFILIYKRITADYGGGGDDLVAKYPGFATITAAILKAALLFASGDKIQYIFPLTSGGISPAVNTGIAIAGTAYSDPGTAAGTLRVLTYYHKVATGL